MQARMEELQEKLRQAELAHEESQKHGAVLQVKLDEALKEQGMLEENVHEHTERIEELEIEKKESLRARREMEQIYESERAAAMKEKDEAMAKEEELQASMQRLKESLAQREMRAGLDDELRRPSVSRQSSGGRSNTVSPNPEATDRQFAPSSIQRSDSASRSNSKLVMQKDKIIESLRLELAEAQIKLVEMENMGGGQLQELQKQVYDIKMQNARLMEENESFQLLLSEKTLNGDFLRPTSNMDSRPPSSRNPTAGEGRGTSLADELEGQDDNEGGEGPRHLQSEVNSLKDQNKALTLYINNIISRLLQHEQFEQILDKTPDLMAGPGAASVRYQDKDKDLPPLPPDKDEKPAEDGAAGFLQRAKSVMGGKRPRPTSQTVQPESLLRPDEVATVHENPETAPSVPLGRSRSVRNTGSGHRRVNSEWPAASLVTNMYRGTSPAAPGPLSPGLSSQGRNSFFTSQTPPLGPRTLSGGSAGPITSPEKENTQPQRDSKFSHRKSDSITSNPATMTGTIDGLDNIQERPPTGSERLEPASPPRSVASSGDRESTKPSGAIMMGSRMRPLRLVQETAGQEEAAKAQAKRGSWFGWMNKGGIPGIGAAKSDSGDGSTPPS